MPAEITGNIVQVTFAIATRIFPPHGEYWVIRREIALPMALLNWSTGCDRRRQSTAQPQMVHELTTYGLTA